MLYITVAEARGRPQQVEQAYDDRATVLLESEIYIEWCVDYTGIQIREPVNPVFVVGIRKEWKRRHLPVGADKTMVPQEPEREKH